ncbi:sulfite exporter TauE/SafE family protein [Prauserella flavalba]|uniref:sulfite exporter TauE/SafE family protein n=1 Tax=Prauserella flavalba TaxID=1477506 RepID=UPI0036EDFAAE
MTLLAGCGVHRRSCHRNAGRPDRSRRRRVPPSAPDRDVRFRCPRRGHPEQGDESDRRSHRTARPRLFALPYTEVAAHWTIAANLLAGSLVGAWLGASWATRMHSRTLYRVLAILLVLIAVALAASHLGNLGSLALPPLARVVVAVAAGIGIGVVAALMGVAGGELLIPTIVLLFAVDIKLAGSLSLLVSLPTMLVAFARYSRDQSFQILRNNSRFVLTMAAGSIAGTLIGGLLLGLVPSLALIPALAALLLISAVKVWRHQ